MALSLCFMYAIIHNLTVNMCEQPRLPLLQTMGGNNTQLTQQMISALHSIDLEA